MRNTDQFDPRAARRQAVLFRKERFETELFGYLDRMLRSTHSTERKIAA